jgi:hypothetical protein
MMPFTVSSISMLLFSASLVGTYWATRSGKLPLSTVWGVGSLVNSSLFCLFALSRSLLLIDALMAGVLLGLIFNSSSILLGVLFKGLALSTLEQSKDVFVRGGRSF